MTQLASYFTEALSNIEPGDDARNAKSAHEEVRATLLKSTDLTDLGIDPVLIGSYKRHVSIRRVKDVDVFGRLKDADSDLAPGAALDLFEKALEVDFAGRIEPQARSFKIDFPDEELTVDVVPARPSGNHWEIPKKEAQDKRAGWLATNPLQFNELTTAANAEFLLNDKGIYVPTVEARASGAPQLPARRTSRRLLLRGDDLLGVCRRRPEGDQPGRIPGVRSRADRRDTRPGGGERPGRPHLAGQDHQHARRRRRSGARDGPAHGGPRPGRRGVAR
ncbi:nucleotidyltransferase [Nocardioides panacis]|uniref:Nucleotidyltransferase n=1 Tax=Nocardioides panacis TaxID=2849501 RepID=A0A975T1G1_9ACTN|nr:nucleotidyltransferase [Nocardioides panacis]